MTAVDVVLHPITSGNHDQVSLGGSTHSLEPLMYAFAPDQILMISEPTICLGALWIPYRRDHSLMKTILREGTAGNVEGSGGVSIIYCHADIRGASMNDGMKCMEGIEVSDFPTNIPIYSGHFHKPHTVSTNCFRRGKSDVVSIPLKPK